MATARKNNRGGVLVPDWKQKALAAYKDGASDAEVIGLMQITRSKFDDLCRTDPDFADLVEFGRDLSKAFWYSMGRINLENNRFNTSLWYANMKNRFGWSDKVTNEERKAVEEKSDDELLAELRAKLAKMEKTDNVTPLRSV